MECVELLRELECRCVYGNSDDILVTLDLGAEPIDDEEHRERLLQTARWSRVQLGEEGLEFLRGFEPVVEIEGLVCCHATPSSNEHVVLPSTPAVEVEQILEGSDGSAVAAGHVHLQWLRRFANKLWFCVGSVGLVWEEEAVGDVPFLPWSEYAVVELPSLAVEFRRIPFDVEQLIEVARKKDFPGIERWAARWQR